MNQTQSKMAVGHIKLESPENTEEMVKEKLQRWTISQTIFQKT